MGGVAAREKGGEEVEGEGEAGALPEADWQGAGGLGDGCGIRGELAVTIVAAGDGERLVAFAVGVELAVGELAHGHVEHDVGPAGVVALGSAAGDGEDERVVADRGGGGTPGGEVGHGVGPADGEETLVGGLPAVGSGAHPVIGVGEGDGAEAVRAGEGDGALHGREGVEVADAGVAVPALERAVAKDEGRGRCDVDQAAADRGDEAGETIEAVSVDAVAGGLGDEAGGEGGAVGREAEGGEGAGEVAVEIGEGDAHEGYGSCGFGFRVASLRGV